MNPKNKKQNQERDKKRNNESPSWPNSATSDIVDTTAVFTSLFSSDSSSSYDSGSSSCDCGGGSCGGD